MFRRPYVCAALCLFIAARSVGVSAVEATPPIDAAARTAVCGGCHGATGNSLVPNFPKLAGQQSDYLRKQLSDFKSGARVDAMMGGMVAGLSADDVQVIALYFSQQVAATPVLDGAVDKLGESIYQRGDASRGIPPCSACHGTLGAGYPGFMPGGIPAVAGQHATYTEKQLRAFRTAERVNDKGGMMRQVASKLSDAEIVAVSRYLNGLHP